MGMDGRKIDFVDALVSTLNRQGQIILVHVDPDEIITKSQGVSNSARVLANYYLRDQSLRSYFNKYQFLDASIIRFAHTYSYNGKALGILKNYFFPQTKLLKNKGYEPLFPTETQKEILTKQYSALNLDTLPNSDITLRETSINYEEHLTNILEKCARNRARLIFFSSPTLVPYNGPSVKGYFDNRQLEYYDYSNYFNYYQPEDWKDLSHLSSIGAEKFSTKLIEEIVLSEEIKY